MAAPERELIESLVPRVTRNAAVIGIDEDPGQYRVTIAGTTGVVARCDLPRRAVENALTGDAARRSLAAALKEVADGTVAEIADGRG